MEQTVGLDKIYKAIIELRKEVDLIKTHIIDMDSILTPEEDAELDESLRELREGKTFSLEDIKKDRKDV